MLLVSVTVGSLRDADLCGCMNYIFHCSARSEVLGISTLAGSYLPRAKDQLSEYQREWMC